MRVIQDYDQTIRCGEVGDLAEIVLRTCGGDVCMTDMKKPGKCINGFIIKPTFAVIVSRELLPLYPVPLPNFLLMVLRK